MATLSISELALHVAPILKLCRRDQLVAALGPRVAMAMDHWCQAAENATSAKQDNGGCFTMASNNTYISPAAVGAPHGEEQEGEEELRADDITDFDD